jgi:hypothetical protein
MKRTTWFFAFVLTIVSSGAVGGKEPCCPKAPSFGLPIAGGPNADEAKAIGFNTDYKLNHHQKKGSKDYFYFKLKPGAEITLGLKALDKGIDLSGKRALETKKPYARLELQDPDGASLAVLAINGEPRQLRRASHKVTRPGRYLLALGSDAGDMNKDQTVFKVTLVPTVLNCPAQEEPAVALDTALPQENCLGGGDEGNGADSFEFHAEKREVYRIAIAMPEGTSADLRAKLTFRNRVKKTKLLAEASGSGGRVTLESVRMPQDGDYFLEVSLAKPLKEVVPYTLTLTRTSTR